MIRAVVDLNVLVSAFILARGIPFEMLGPDLPV
jgi:predicted nucleic acid-binding protein